MASKGTWRQEMEMNSAKQFGLINGLGQWLQKKDQTYSRVVYAQFGLHAAMIIVVLGLVMGWW